MQGCCILTQFRSSVSTPNKSLAANAMHANMSYSVIASLPLHISIITPSSSISFDIAVLLAERGDGGAITQHEFARLVQRVVHSHKVDEEEVGLLYRIFDANRDGFLELGELVRQAWFPIVMPVHMCPSHAILYMRTRL